MLATISFSIMTLFCFECIKKVKCYDFQIINILLVSTSKAKQCPFCYLHKTCVKSSLYNPPFLLIHQIVFPNPSECHYTLKGAFCHTLLKVQRTRPLHPYVICYSFVLLSLYCVCQIKSHSKSSRSFFPLRHSREDCSGPLFSP